MRFPKFTYYRSKAHLKNVASLPCKVCGIDGYTQAAHSNWVQWGGKCKAKKASDEYTAAICVQCHYQIDAGKDLTKEERLDLWKKAHTATVQHLVILKLWPHDVPIPVLQDFYNSEQ